eukprot:403358661
MLWKVKKMKVSELLEIIKKQQGQNDQKNQIEEKESYMKRLNKIISENLQLVIKNCHFRFEDSYISRKDQMMNYGIVLNQLTYSMTNSNYQRVFIDIDNKRLEQRSYSMLELQNLAMYWNSNAKENWHKNKDFLNLSPQKHIDHSKKFVEGLRKKYQQFQQKLISSSCFLIQPCDLKFRFRKNLSPQTILEVPKSTTAIEISGLQLQLDEEVYKDVQYLLKFFSWHQRGGTENKHFKFRPSYNIQVRGNAMLYWKYAISSTVYYIRKTKREKLIKAKRHLQIFELSELYVMQQVNDYYDRQGYQQRLLSSSLSSQDTGSQSLELMFQNQEEVQDRVYRLETKLSPEQIVIAMKRAEKKGQQKIQEEINNSGWKSWIPGTLKNYYKSHISGASSDTSATPSDLQDFDNMVQSYQDIQSEDEEEAIDDQQIEASLSSSNLELAHSSLQSPNMQEFKTQGFKVKTQSHMTLNIPKIDIMFVTKKQGSNSKYFMLLSIQETFYQSISNSRESSNLLIIKNLEVIDRLIEKQKFSRALYKRDVEKPRQKLSNDLDRSELKKRATRLKFNDFNSERTEIDEEANTNVNNGLPLYIDYEHILSGESDQSPFMVFQLNQRSVNRKGDKIQQYKVDFFMNSLQVFYNRLLLSRFQTFMNTASIHKTQNTSAEADFDSRLEQFKQKTQDKVKQMLKKSEIFVCCNLKGMEILIPDNTNYDASKFLIFQTGNIVVKNGLSHQSHYVLRNKLVSQMDQDFPNVKEDINFDFTDEYSLTIYDSVLYYAPTMQQLENFSFIENQQEYERFIILKKTDIHFDIQKQTTQLQEDTKIEQKYLIQTGLNCLELQITNKELKELKHFSDSFQKYHDQISLEVQRELQYLEHINAQQMKFEKEFNRLHRRSFDELDQDEDSIQNGIEQDLMMQTIISNQKNQSLNTLHGTLTSSLGDSTQNLQAALNAFQSNKNQHSNQLESESDEDEFYDAQDVFDQDIIQMLKLDKNFETVQEADVKQKQQQVKNSLVQSKIIFEFWINKFKLSVLESTNLQQDIMQGLKSKLGNFVMKDQLQFDMRYKGIPFLHFEIGKLGVMYINYKSNTYTAFQLHELALINMDNSSVLKKSQQIILKSQNYDHDDYLQADDSPREMNQQKQEHLRKPIFDLEDEDRINMIEQNQDSDQFMSVSFANQLKDEDFRSDVITKIGLLEFQISENLLNKIIQSLIIDFPQTRSNQMQKPLQQQTKGKFQNISIEWEGLDCKLLVKKEVSNFKVLNLKVENNQDGLDVKQNIKLGEFRVLQNEQELFLKSIEAIDEYDCMLQYEDEVYHGFKTKNIQLNYMVLILDMKLVNQLIQSLFKLQKQLNQIKEVKQDRQPSQVDQLHEEEGEQRLKAQIANSYVQIPLKENKNSMYLKIKEINISQEKGVNNIDYDQIMLFIAKSQFQDAIYPLIQTQGFQMILGKGLKAIELQQLIITINENYILLLANLVEHHFEDSFQIMQNFTQNNQNANQISNEHALNLNMINAQILTQEEVKDKIFQVKLCEFTVNMLKALDSLIEIQSINIGSISLEWIFGLGFEDHEDNFVTLYNKNQSQQILQQFEQEKTDFEFIDAFNKKSSQAFDNFNQENLLNSQNYDKVSIKMDEITVNILKIIENQEVCSNFISQFKSLQLVQQQKGYEAKSVLYFGVGMNKNQKIGLQFVQDHKHHQEAFINLIEAQITNLNVRMISSLIKSIYSCKNILKRGKKRELIQKLMGDPKPSNNSQSSHNKPQKTLNLEIYQFRLAIGLQKEKKQNDFESQMQTGAHTLIQMLSSNLKDEFENNMSQDQYMLVIESSLKIQIYNKQKQPNMQNLYFTGNFMDVLAKNVSIYLDPNSKSLSCSNLMDTTAKVTLIHPFNIEFSQSQIDAKNMLGTQQSTNEIYISLIEIEISLRQTFYIKLLIENIMEELAPINQVFKHYQQNQVKITKKKQKEMQQNFSREQNQLSNFSIVFKQFYFVLIKESGDTSIKQDQLCLPMFSIEMRNTSVDIQNQLDNNRLITGTLPLEVYYFNKKLNFYEPLIEKTKVEFIIQEAKNKSENIEIKINKIINFNFSVALYETIFNVQSTLNEENSLYEALKLQKIEQKDNYSKQRKEMKLASSQYYIKNSTGEILMFKTTNQPIFQELQPEELNELDFDAVVDNISQSNKLEETQQLIQDEDDHNMDDMNVDLYNDEFEFEDHLNAEIFRKLAQTMRPVSNYRRENLRYLRGQPKKVFLQLILANETYVEKTSVFEINIENLNCQRIYLDEQRQIYIICQIVQKHGAKQLIIKSPMQITNNLQIPLEIQLIQNQKQPIQKQEVSAFDNEQLFESQNRNFGTHDLIIQPEQSLIIPLKACGFEQIRMRPVIMNEKANRKDQALFEWTDVVDVSLLQDDREIFEKKPLILSSKVLNANIAQRKNDSLFFVLNANVYSIRSFIDFNTQQTEFISLKYLQISPPFVIQNLLPVHMSLVFRNIIRDNQTYYINAEKKSKQFRDKQNYILETKMNSSNQTLFLNPLGNFEMSLCIPGFDNSTFVALKNEEDDDYKLTEQIEQENYIKSMFEDNGEEETQQQNFTFVGKNQFRFLKQKKLLFQLTSQFQNQFNVCANFAFIQGYYHISFYSKYWFLNNTQMPLQIQMTTENFAFDKYDLPYENIDFDFQSINKYNKNEMESSNQDEFDKNCTKLGRKNSLDSFQTETVKDGKSHAKYSSVKSHINKGEYDINYRELHHALAKSNPNGHSRLKPWESYKIDDDMNQGIISALSNEDINKVSTIYMAQELLDEEELEKDEEKKLENIDTKVSKKSVRFMPQGRLVDEVTYTQEELKQEIENYQSKYEKQTMISKNSIQYINYHDFLAQNDVLNLNYLPVAKPNLFETPLMDKNQLKRVILFSESPVEDLLYENQSLKIKISDSIWSNIIFDISKLQGESISIQDKRRHETQQSVFEIVSQVSYLPYPFSFSKLITFNPKYTIINKTYFTLYVIQSECEENGIFKIFPQETSVFHWTDSQKENYVSVKLEDYEYSGKFKIDVIGEFNIRLKSTFDNECMIINLLINEENNQFFIVVSDISFAPPYRIENLTKTTFKVAQQDSRSDDFDIIKPFNIISFAWSYPLGNKLLAISICSQSQDTYLGPYNIDHIKKNEQILLKDKKNNRDFILEIINEKTMKCVRIMNAQNATSHAELIKIQEEMKQKDTTKKLKVTIKNLDLAPFDLNLDGNFCDEFYKYILDIFSHAKRYSQQESFKQIGQNPYDESEEIERMKETINELKKPYEKKDSQVQKKVFFEQFFINDIRLNFSFQSSPILFREFTMNPTLKFFIVLLSNLKNVQLKFSQYKISHQHLLLPIFVSQIKKHYIYQCYSHQQFLEIVSSMGLFGNLGETANSLQYAFKSLFQNPYRIGLKQFVKGGFSFLKHTITAVVGPVGSILDSFRRGIYFIISSSHEDQDFSNLTVDKDLFEDDISQASRELNSFSSPLALIDTQNRIWMKIISREKQNYEVKKKQLMKIKEINTDQLEQRGRRQGNLRQIFSTGQANRNHGPISKGFQILYEGVVFVPKIAWTGSSSFLGWINYQLSEDQVQVRTLKKALALQILNDINLNVLESETIQRVFQFSENSIIFTGKRFICVQKEPNPITKIKHYKHWNILFKDVIKVTVQVVNKVTEKQVQQEYFLNLIQDEDLNRHELENMVFWMKIHYHQIGDAGETGEIDEGLSNIGLDSSKRSTNGKLLANGMSGLGLGYDQFGDLRVGVKKIFASYLEDSKLRRFYYQLERKISKINFIK